MAIRLIRFSNLTTGRILGMRPRLENLSVPPAKLLIEVMYKADYCLLCYYMDEAVREMMPQYETIAKYHRVDLLTAVGKKRFLELSVSLFGEKGVYEHKRIAPVPSLFINGELVFEEIPPRFELEEAIEEALTRLEESKNESGASRSSA